MWQRKNHAVAPVGFLNHQTEGLYKKQCPNEKLDCLVWDVLFVKLYDAKF